MKKMMVVQSHFQDFEEDSDNENDLEPNYIVTKIEETKNSNITIYNHLLF